MNEKLAYFEKDVKYDKTFYDNGWRDYLQIVVALFFFYSIFTLIFWGHMSYAEADSIAAMWTNVGFLIGAAVWVLVNAFVGAQTNKLLYRIEYYQEIISAKEQDVKDIHAKAEQARVTEARLAERARTEALKQSQI